jgi:hypothetical protein
VLADVSFWDFGQGPICDVALRSYWQGRAVLGGQDWQVGIVPDNLNSPASFENSRLLLRPWQERDEVFSATDSSLDTFPFSRKLFADGHSYQLTCRTGSQNGEVSPILEFAEEPVALDEVKITGKYIKRLILSGESYRVVLDQPAAAVKVPIGHYNQPTALLEQNGVTAYCNTIGQLSGKQISVDGKAPAILAVGGPLTNTVIATRDGRDLVLNYQLIGAGGQAYLLANRDYEHPPEFAIYKNGKTIASGKFEFG